MKHGLFALALAACVDRDVDGDGVLVPVDCDDADAAVHPDAGETCGNDVDDDCDGVARGCGVAGWGEIAADGARIAGPASTQRAWYLGEATPLGDLDGDGRDDLAVRASASEDPRSYVWVVGGPLPAAQVLAPTEATLIVHGDGRALSAADFDGDGVVELLAEVSVQGLVLGSERAVHIYDLAAGGEGPRARLRFADSNSGLVRPVGDVDGDGLADVVVTADYWGEEDARSGAAWVLAGGLSGDVAVDTRGVQITGTRDLERVGARVADADLDGDGLSDLLIGSNDAVYVFPAPIGAGTVADAAATLPNAASIATGDLDGDGAADVVLGLPRAEVGESAEGEPSGAVYVFLGPGIASHATDAAVATIVGEAGAGYAGEAVALPGDMDGDGLGEIALSGRTGWTEGVFLFPGDVRGTLRTSEAPTARFGSYTYDQVGYGLLPAGDTDGDGFADLLVAAPGWEEEDRYGAWFVVRGGPGF